jgi:hypothetical protein
MKGKMLFFIFSFLVKSYFSFRCIRSLHNDSGFRLKAVVIAANGTKMEKMLDPEQSGYVEDFIGQSDPVGQQQTLEGDSDILSPLHCFLVL